jgi:hypothetical protein
VSNSIQVAISGEEKRQILGQKPACRDEVRAIRIYVGSLLKQIDGDALAVDYEDTFPERA